MQRRNFPSVLLYGLGLALALSLAFNGFLLREQTRIRSEFEPEFDDVRPINSDPDGDQRRFSSSQPVGPRSDTLLADRNKTPTHPRSTRF